jgi:hypothetical protein
VARRRAFRRGAGLVRVQLFRPLSGTAPRRRCRSSAAWNVTLFTLFAFHHSLFARDAVRVRVERLFPGRERSVFVWVASLAFAAVCAAWHGVPGVVWQAGGAAAWALYITRAAGIGADPAGRRHPRTSGSVAGTRPPRHAPGEHGGGPPRSRAGGPYGLGAASHLLGDGFLVVFSVPAMTATQLVIAECQRAYIRGRDGVR